MSTTAPAHPLFPPLDDAKDPPVFERIGVSRLESRGPVWVPRSFAPEEIQDLDDLYARFGGGTYELVARAAATQRIVARRVYTIPGKSKPLDGEPAAEAAAPTPVPQFVAPSDRNEDRFLALITLMMQQQAQSQQMMMQLITTVLASTKQESKDFVQAMASLNGQDKATMGAVLQAVMANAGKGGGGGSGNPVEDAGHMLVNMLQIVETMKASAGEIMGGGPSSEGGLMKDFVQAMSSMESLARMKRESEAAATAPVASQLASQNGQQAGPSVGAGGASNDSLQRAG